MSAAGIKDLERIIESAWETRDTITPATGGELRGALGVGAVCGFLPVEGHDGNVRMVLG